MNGVTDLLFETFGGAVAALLNTFWMGAAVAAVAWVVLRYGPRVNAATRYAIWWAVLAAVVALPLAQRAKDELPMNAAPAVTTSTPVAIAEAPVEEAPVPVAASAPVAAIEPAAEPVGPVALTAGNWVAWVLAAWAMVFLFRLAQIVRSYLWVRGIKQRARRASREQSLNFDTWILACGIDRPVRLLVSNEIVSPMAVGFARPAVILPEALIDEFSQAELDHVLLHELAHMARLDDWTNLLARLAAAALALHPVAAWVVNRIDRERESACDDWVVSMTGDARPYAASLTRMFELSSGRRQLLASGMAEGGSRLGERVERLLEKGRSFVPGVSVKVLLAGAAALLGLVVAGSQSPEWVVYAQEPTAAPRTPESPAPPEPFATVPQAPEPPEAPPAPVRPRTAEEAMQRAELARQRVALEANLRAIEQQAREAQADGNARVLEQLRAELEALRAQRSGLELQMSQLGSLERLLAQAPPRAAEVVSPAPGSRYSEFDAFQGYRRRSLVAELKEAGLTNLSVEEIIEMAQSGLTVEAMKAYTDLGWANLDRRKMIELSQSGVRPAFLQALKENGFGDVTPDKAIEAAQSGVRAQDLKTAKEYNSNLTLDDIIKLKQAGAL